MLRERMPGDRAEYQKGLDSDSLVDHQDRLEQLHNLREAVKTAGQTAANLQAYYQTREVAYFARIQKLSQVSHYGTQP